MQSKVYVHFSFKQKWELEKRMKKHNNKKSAVPVHVQAQQYEWYNEKTISIRNNNTEQSWKVKQIAQVINWRIKYWKQKKKAELIL